MGKNRKLRINSQKILQEEEFRQEEIRQNYKKDLQEGIRYSIGKLDDQILYISSGALALSLSFIKDLVPLNQAVFLILLFFSWSFLTLSISLSLYSHLHSYNAHQEQIDRLENGEDLLDEDKFTKWINKITMGFLILGIVLQVSFAIINLSKMPKPTPFQSTSNSKPVQIVAPESGEKLGLPVSKAPKSLKPPTPSTSKNNN